MYFHQWSDVTRRAKVLFFFSLSRATKVRPSLSCLVSQRGSANCNLSPPPFFSLDSLICPPFPPSSPFNDQNPLSLSDTRVDDTFRFPDRLCDATHVGNARSQWAIKTEQIRIVVFLNFFLERLRSIFLYINGRKPWCVFSYSFRD